MEATPRTPALDLPLPHPLPVPERVIRIRDEVDWEAFLPARAHTLRWRVGQAVKRTIDIVASAIGLLVLLPFFVLIALLVRATSRGPVLYRSKYLGYRARPFFGYKFRTMVSNADQLKRSMAHLNHMHGPAFKIRNDPRVTSLGGFLRKYSIDELPQLWSVLKGDMSLVGPRPPLPEEFEQYQAWHRGKLAIKPGITCYWQINGRSDIHDFDEWMRLDLKYIEAWSLWTDLKILARTVPAVLRGHGAY
jgi:lipopolysaccharide/colanic/teichoic acid biosynthesis glycosyltransferase